MKRSTVFAVVAIVAFLLLGGFGSDYDGMGFILINLFGFIVIIGAILCSAECSNVENENDKKQKKS